MKSWLILRVILIFAALLQGMLMDGVAPPPEDSSLPILGVIFIFGIVGMLFVVGIQAFNPLSASVWRYPSWHINPFLLKEPLQFFHFGGYYFLALGGGILIRHLATSHPLGPDSFFLLSLASGILAGVWACTVVFRRKMAHGT
jgi:hypothetical protein